MARRPEDANGRQDDPVVSGRQDDAHVVDPRTSGAGDPGVNVVERRLEPQPVQRVEPERAAVGSDDRYDRAPETPRKHKTSAAAVFSLVFGLASVFLIVTLLGAPIAILFGVVALVLGVIGISMSGRPGVTGRGVAIGGIVLGLLGLLLGIGILAGLASFLLNEANIGRIESQIENIRQEIPTELPT